MARRARQPSVVRWVTKLVTRGGKQFRQRYRVAEKSAKKLGRRVAKQVKREAKELGRVRARARKKAATAGARKKKSTTSPTWRELVVEGRRRWIRLGAGGAGSLGTAQSKRAAALAALQRRGQSAAALPTGMGKWQKTGKDTRHLRHKDYVAPHTPPKRRK